MARFSAPPQPGCYLFKDDAGTIIYVGKAKNLRSRVASYFNNSPKTPKTEQLVKNITSAQFIVVNNEIEALLLENRLIKQHKPKFNIDLKDDKRYAYLLVTDEEFPRLITTRNPKAKGTLYGPYADGFARRDVQDLCQRLFHLRTCNTMPKRICLMFHLGRCDGPCEGRISTDDYARRVNQAKAVLAGDIMPVITQLNAQMKTASGAQRYELARWCRDAIASLQAVQERQSVDKHRQYDQDAIGMATNGTTTTICILHVRKGVITRKSDFRVSHTDDVLCAFLQAYYDNHDIPNKILLPQAVDESDLLERWLSQRRGSTVNISVPHHGDAHDLTIMAQKNAQLGVEDVHPGVVALKDALNLPQLPRTIEVFDISTLQGTNTVGAMVQFVNGKSNPSGYRKFIIKKAHAQDDTACMREVVGRRYTRLIAEGKTLPDLIVIDGGPLQLAAARLALAPLNTSIPIISLAKQFEEIFLPHATDPLRLPPKNPAILLLRQARDAVHNHVISFHRTRRGNAMVTSALDDIPGLGEKSKNALLARFGTIAGVRRATLDDLRKILPDHTARATHERLRQ